MFPIAETKSPNCWDFWFLILGLLVFDTGIIGFSMWEKDILFPFSTFPDFTRHFFSSLAETVDSCFVVVLNR